MKFKKNDNYFEFKPIRYQYPISKDTDKLNWIVFEFNILVDGKKCLVDDPCVGTYNFLKFVTDLKMHLNDLDFNVSSEFTDDIFSINLSRKTNVITIKLSYKTETDVLEFSKHLSHQEFADLVFDLEEESHEYPIRQIADDDIFSDLGSKPLDRAFSKTVLIALVIVLFSIFCCFWFWPSWIIGVGVSVLLVLVAYFIELYKSRHNKNISQHIDIHESKSMMFLDIEHQSSKMFEQLMGMLTDKVDPKIEKKGDVITLNLNFSANYNCEIDFSNDSAYMNIHEAGINFERDYNYESYSSTRSLFKEITRDIKHNQEQIAKKLK